MKLTRPKSYCILICQSPTGVLVTLTERAAGKTGPFVTLIKHTYVGTCLFVTGRQNNWWDHRINLLCWLVLGCCCFVQGSIMKWCEVTIFSSLQPFLSFFLVFYFAWIVKGSGKYCHGNNPITLSNSPWCCPRHLPCNTFSEVIYVERRLC